MESVGLRQVRRRPEDLFVAAFNGAHVYPMATPLPLSDYLLGTGASAAPDCGLPDVWPYGYEHEITGR